MVEIHNQSHQAPFFDTTHVTQKLCGNHGIGLCVGCADKGCI